MCILKANTSAKPIHPLAISSELGEKIFFQAKAKNQKRKEGKKKGKKKRKKIEKKYKTSDEREQLK